MSKFIASPKTRAKLSRNARGKHPWAFENSARGKKLRETMEVPFKAADVSEAERLLPKDMLRTRGEEI